MLVRGRIPVATARAPTTRGAVDEGASDTSAGTIGSVSRLGAPLLRVREDGWWLRARRARRSLGPIDALLVRGPRAALALGHTTTVDIVFLDGGGRIVRLLALPPREHAVCRQARARLTLARGTAARLDFAPGQVLKIDVDGRGNAAGRRPGG